MPWEEGQRIEIEFKYPRLLYVDDYLEIQRFLRTEQSLNKVLKILEKNVFVGCKTSEQFEEQLTRIEKELKFWPGVVTVQKLLTPEQFLNYVYFLKPLYDVGAGDRHGYNTHRVQWLMVSIASEVKLINLKQNILELYRNTACANAYKSPQNPLLPASQEDSITGEGWIFLWDDLFDQVYKITNEGTKNGSAPEFLHQQHVLTDKKMQYPTLASCWA